MMPQLRSVLAGKDPSLPLAMAALLDKADDSGSVTFRDLAVAYREEYLEAQRIEWGDFFLQEAVGEGKVLYEAAHA